jgi:hypothetical protein
LLTVRSRSRSKREAKRVVTVARGHDVVKVLLVLLCLVLPFLALLIKKGPWRRRRSRLAITG